MSRVHGYKIKLAAFLPAEPFNVDELTLAENGFNDVELAAAPGSKITREVPAAPAGAREPMQSGLLVQTPMTPTMTMPAIPTILKRS